MGMIVGCFVFALSFWSPSCVASMDCSGCFYAHLCFKVFHWFVSHVHAEDRPYSAVMCLEEVM